MKRILILGSKNSVRSQMAQEFLKRITFGRVEVFSAGVKPSSVHPLAIRVMSELGIDISKNESNSVNKLKERINEAIEEENAITVKDLAVNGYDIMNELNLKPGPIIGKILNTLLEVILDDPSKNTKLTLLILAKEMLSREKQKVNAVKMK